VRIGVFIKRYKSYIVNFLSEVPLKEKDDVIKRELTLCGYFVIVTSAKMTAEEAIDLYYGRDASEKLFRGDKSYLGNKSIRVYTEESAEAKIFVEFVALIVRNRIYTKLKEEDEKLDTSQNYMTVPATIRELEKIRKAEERVIKTGETYNIACEELKELRNKRAAIENEILIDAFMRSNKTFEEAMEFFKSDMKTEDKLPKKRGRKKKILN